MERRGSNPLVVPALVALALVVAGLLWFGSRGQAHKRAPGATTPASAPASEGSKQEPAKTEPSSVEVFPG